MFIGWQAAAVARAGAAGGPPVDRAVALLRRFPHPGCPRPPLRRQWIPAFAGMTREEWRARRRWRGLVPPGAAGRSRRGSATRVSSHRLPLPAPPTTLDPRIRGDEAGRVARVGAAAVARAGVAGGRRSIAPWLCSAGFLAPVAFDRILPRHWIPAFAGITREEWRAWDRRWWPGLVPLGAAGRSRRGSATRVSSLRLPLTASSSDTGSPRSRG
jgi:hypothetical protein